MFGIIVSGKWNFIRTDTMWYGIKDYTPRTYSYPKSVNDTLVGPVELAQWKE